MIKYTNEIDNIKEENLAGFFVDWPNPPTTKKHLKLLKNSDVVFIAIDEKTDNVVGFITAITDKTLSAYIPFLEVLPEYQKQGIGKNLVNLMFNELKDFYMIDIVCDESMVEFYQRFEMFKCVSMIKRNFNSQCGI